METIILALGLIFGANLFSERTRRINNVLRSTINELEQNIEIDKSIIKDYQEENEILLNNASELRSKIVDLENNIELLVNNLSDENKALVCDDQSN